MRHQFIPVSDCCGEPLNSQESPTCPKCNLSCSIDFAVNNTGEEEKELFEDFIE